MVENYLFSNRRQKDLESTNEIRKKIKDLLQLNPEESKRLALDLVAREPDLAVNYKNLAVCFALLDDLQRALSTLELAKNRLSSDSFYLESTAIEIFREKQMQSELTAKAAKLICNPEIKTSQKVEIFQKHSEVFDGKVLIRQLPDLRTVASGNNVLFLELLIALNQTGNQEVVKLLLPEIPNVSQLDHLSKRRLSILYVQNDDSRKALALREELASEPQSEESHIEDLNEIQVIKFKLGYVAESIEATEYLLEKYPHTPNSLRIRAFHEYYVEDSDLTVIKNSSLKYGACLIPVERRKSESSNRSAGPVSIGFLSSNFSAHPVGWMTAGFFCEAPNYPDLANIHILSFKTDVDFVSKTIEESGNRFHKFDDFDDREALEMIKGLDLDILVDLDGFQADHNLPIILSKPAPILVKWVGGLIGSMWLPEYDYLITDSHHTPPAFESDFSEKLIRGEHSYVTYTPPPYPNARQKPPFEDNKYITFGCFNNISKLTPGCLRAWSEILNQTPKSRLFLKDSRLSDLGARERIQSILAKSGVGRDRISFEGRSVHEDHVKKIAEVDICLDPMPYSGGLSTLEAIYQGVPVITLAGRCLAHRHSTSHLNVIGHSELVTSSSDEYIGLAVDLATNTERLGLYRKTLKDDLFASPLLQHKRFTEDLLKKMAALVS